MLVQSGGLDMILKNDNKIEFSTIQSFLLGFAGLFTLFACSTSVEQTSPDKLTVVERVEHIDELALREPMLVEHTTGVLFVAGYSRAEDEFTDPPNLYLSQDKGKNWEMVNVGTPEQGALGNSDVDLAIAPDGTIYFLTMSFDRSVFEGTHIAVGVSHDVGATWTWKYLSQDRFDDRPWIAITPEGVAHVIWNDGSGVSHAMSNDRGETWEERAKIHPSGGSSHLAIGPNGEIAVRIVPISASGNQFDKGVDLFAISTDGGEVWNLHEAPGERIWDYTIESSKLIPRWVEPVTWDANGHLYYLWSEGLELRLGLSTDQAKTWKIWSLLMTETPIYYPFLAVNNSGELAASWFSGVGDSLRGHIGIITITQNKPTLVTTEPLAIESWRIADDSKVLDTAGEYFPVTFLTNGDIGSVLTIQESEKGNGFVWLRISR
jgi:hypothetical protein